MKIGDILSVLSELVDDLIDDKILTNNIITTNG